MAAAKTKDLSEVYVPRVVSFLVLLAIILLVGIVFFRVMAQFIVPLFLACVLLVVFQPLHRWILGKMPNWPRAAALITTITILLTVLVPTFWLGWNAYVESAERIQAFEAEGGDESKVLENLDAQIKKWAGDLNDRFPDLNLDVGIVLKDAVAWVGNKLPLVAGTLVRILVGLVIMIVALYYFLADGPAMINGMINLSPLDRRHELELLARFAEISRSVVVATMLSAVAQGLLAGIGFYFALPSSAPIFLLTALTIVLAIVPFIGAAGVWVPVCLMIGLFGERMVDGQTTHDGNWPVAIGLGVYCGIVVSGIDNVIKPLVLHGQANLHPLLALLSILGGVTVLGPVGILVGPMLVSFLQALLTMFRKELERWDDPTRQSLVTLSPGAQALAEHIEAAVEAVAGEESESKSAATKGAIAKASGGKKKGK